MEQEAAPRIVLKELAGNPPPHLNAIQQFLSPYVEFLTTVWIAVWIMTSVVLIIKLWHEYRKHTRRG